MDINKVIQGDCIDYMKNNMPDNSVDIIIADPPYNLSKGGKYKISQDNKPKGFGGDWNKVMENWDNIPLIEYLKFTQEWLKEAKRILKPTGSIWIHGSYHNIGIINFAMQLIDFEIINEIVWYKRNSFPNLTGKRLTASHETILWGHSGSSKKREYNFNYEYSKKVKYSEDTLKVADKQMRTVWDVPNNKKKEELKFGKHPTQKPVRLIKRILELSAKDGNIVFTPFSGSGTEVVTAKMLGLDYLGVEIDKEYVTLSLKRLADMEKGNYFANDNSYEYKKINTLNSSGALIENVPSLIKWTGSKRLQATEIQEYIPKVFSRYLEPFLGGGSILFNNTSHESLVNDVYSPLIQIWKFVKEKPDYVVEYYTSNWNKLQADFPDYFYVVRDRFNKSFDGLDLLFLSRTAVNGIIRFNNQGLFNNSIHLSRRGMKPTTFAKIVHKWSQKLNNTTFFCEDYKEFLLKAQKDDFVYLDPPYANSKNRYIQNVNSEELFEILRQLNKKSVKWALSFDGKRGETDLQYPIPNDIFKRVFLISNGNSKVGQVLNGKQEIVHEALYMNY